MTAHTRQRLALRALSAVAQYAGDPDQPAEMICYARAYLEQVWALHQDRASDTIPRWRQRKIAQTIADEAHHAHI